MRQDWEAAYIDAMLETDGEKLAAKIDFAKKTLESCLTGLTTGPEDAPRRERISDALRTLDVLRRIEMQASA